MTSVGAGGSSSVPASIGRPGPPLLPSVAGGCKGEPVGAAVLYGLLAGLNGRGEGHGGSRRWGRHGSHRTLYKILKGEVE